MVLQVWNEFVSSTEEQQEALLNSKAGAVSNTDRPVAMDTGNEHGLDDSWEHVDRREGETLLAYCDNQRMSIV